MASSFLSWISSFVRACPLGVNLFSAYLAFSVRRILTTRTTVKEKRGNVCLLAGWRDVPQAYLRLLTNTTMQNL